MPERKPPLRIEAVKGFDRHKVGVKVFAKANGAWGAPSSDIAISGTLWPAEARALGQALIARADEVDARIARDEAAKARRQAWRARQPRINV